MIGVLTIILKTVIWPLLRSVKIADRLICREKHLKLNDRTQSNHESFPNKPRLYVASIFFGITIIARADSQLPWKSPQEAFSDPKVSLLVAKIIEHDIDAARKIRDAGADINALGKLGVTPLIWTVINNDVEGTRILLELGADPSVSANTPNGISSLPPPIWLATATGNGEILLTILKHGGNPNFQYNEIPLLSTAAELGKLTSVKILVQHGATVNYPGTTPGFSAFDEAIYAQNYELALWLWNFGYSGDVRGIYNFLLKEHQAPRPEEARHKEKLLSLMLERMSAKQ